MSFYDTPSEISRLDMRFEYGPKGVGGWTIKADDEGWFYSVFYKKYGKGARSDDFVSDYKYVPRLVGKRRSIKAARTRSINLAHGRPITADVKERAAKVGVGVPNQGYCMKQKKHIIVDHWTPVTARNGRAMLQADCPECGTRIQKYGNLISECPECLGRDKEVAANDYICKECRANAE